ncbi:SEP-domain-containing protein [Phlegmacium glaucopus]|nr:SEP-domain-containing protein [Phlegmacium glaucopus]
MSDDSNNTTGGGRSLGGGAPQPLPSSWSQPSERPRFGRIGDWSGPPSSGNRSGASRFGGPHDDDDDDEDENKEGESWFAGGERSGLSIENPDRQRGIPGGNMVRDLLRRAAQAGPPPEAPPRSSSAFTGGGHTLGSDEVESSYIPDTTSEGIEEETVIRHLTFWRNGFQVEDGELMRYDDPAHAGVLEAMNAGHAPPSITDALPGQHVELRLAKRITEDYVPPKGTQVFSGSGHRLGAVVPDFSPRAESSSTSMPGTFPVSGAAPTRSTAQSSNTDRDSISTRFEVDQSLPTTSIQIRLADGTRMVCRMNLTHTVLDIRNFINASRPENLIRPYTIGTTFPNRVLDDNTATIEGAGLINSVVVQRWV